MGDRPGWFRRLLARSREAVTHPEVVRRLEEAERALKLRALEKSQADADHPRLEGAAALLDAIGQNNAVVLIGSVLLVRRANPDGPGDVFVRTVSQAELIYLERNPHLLRDPESILSALRAVRPGPEISEPGESRALPG